MTTASSIAFPSMEVPIADDTMEMASPLPGHDDFEIDLDVMEDQASNADKDMMGADDYPAGDEIDVDYQRDGANDADMIDDMAEPTMVDADDQYPEANDNEMRYAPEEPYEAEMEDEYVEDSDVPMPKVNEPDPAIVQEENTPKAEGAVEPAQTNGVAEQIKDTEPSSLEPAVDAVESKSDDVTQAVEVPQITLEEHDDRPDSEKVAEETGLAQQGSEQAEHEVSSAVQAGPEPDESHITQPDVGEADQKVLKQAEEKGETAETQPSVDQPEAQVPGPSEEKDGHVTQIQEQRTGLHPVKVYYQDNEISLFPPREGDASETYFLGDESLAYEHVGKLFESFREILRDHIGDNDILVIDIDSMNIQLTEDSMHLSKVTLHQIVNLYLHLCDNESIGEPETLYLSLSTKLTISALLSEIQAAANDGKGLSEIFWDDYDEAAQAEGQPDQKSEQDVSANLPESQAPPESKESEEPEEHHDHNEHQHEHQHEAPSSSEVEAPQAEQQVAPEEHKEPDVGDNQEVEAPDTAEEDTDKYQNGRENEPQPDQSQESEFGVPEQNASYEEEEQARVNENASSGEHVEDAAPAGENENGEEEFEEGEYGDEFQQYDEAENEDQEQAPVVGQSFESEEQKTESTTTLTPLPAQDATDGQQDAGESANVSQAEHGEDIEAGEQPDGETNPDAPEDTEYVDDLEYHATDQAYEDAEPEANGEETHEEPPEEPSWESHEPGLSNEDAPDLASHQDAAAGEASQEDLAGILQEPTESTAEDGVPGMAEEDDQGTAAENPAEIPAEENHNILGDGADHGYDDSGEGWDQNEDVSSTHVKDNGVEDVGLDEFLDIDFDAEFGNPEETGATDAVVSTKRTREPEDETDPTETSTPDIKRTRSS